MTKPFFETVSGECHGDAFLAGIFADMAAYPPKGLGHKHGFLLIEPKGSETAEEVARRLVEDHASPIASPTGPAGCIPVGPRQYLFFGRVKEEGPLGRLPRSHS